MIYNFIKDNKEKYGLNYLLKVFKVNKNAYYNFIKHRKAGCEETKQNILLDIINKYHELSGTVGYRMMCIYLNRDGHKISALTTHRYMNKELKLKSIARREKQEYIHGNTHRVFENKLNREFSAEEKNQKWCTDFTYIILADGRVYYNCTIIDLFDRSVVASVTSDEITAKLAIITTEQQLYEAVKNFAYVYYNYKRPHMYNNYKTPYEKRFEG